MGESMLPRDPQLNLEPPNWVLQPTTTYYRTYGDVEIGTTTASAIFGAAYMPLVNSVEPAPSSDPGNMSTWKLVWTGIGSATDFSAAADCCAGWSDMTNWHTGMTGVAHFTNGYAFADGNWGCAGTQHHLYCVQQP